MRTDQRRHVGRGRIRFGVLVVVALLILAGCNATADVRVTADADGAGTVSVTVRVDADAAKRLPPADGLVSSDDLRKAGWSLVGPTVAADGSFTVLVSKAFKGIDEANRVLAEVSGPDGPLRSLRLDRHLALTATRWRLTGTVDLSKGADTFGDSALTKALGNRTLASVTGGLARPGDGPAGSAVRLTVHADLPGQDRTPGGAGAGLGESAQSFRLTAVQEHTSALWFLVGGVVALVLMVASLWWAIRARRRDRRHPQKHSHARRRGRRSRRRRRHARDA